jgi:cation transport ATPase
MVEDLEDREEIVVKKHQHHWKMRLLVSLVMLILSFIGLIVSDVRRNGAWNYWRVMVPIYALLSIFLTWYLRHKKQKLSSTTIWHELVQWIGLGLAVYLTSVFVNIGLMGRFEAGLVVLTLLALTLFISGIYVEPTFILMGLLLGLFAAAAALLVAYLYTIMLPLTIVAALVLIWIVRRKKSD